MKKNRSTTKGAQKMLNYFEQRLSLVEFSETVHTLRQKYKVPLNGFNKEVQEQWLNRGDPFEPPRKWIYTKEKTKWRELSDDLDQIGIKHELFELSFEFALFEYFFFNTFESTLRLYWSPDLCEVEDRIFKDAYSNAIKSEQLSERIKEQKQRSLLQYPVGIHVSAYASRNEIVDFIDSNIRYIKDLQNQYKQPGSKIGRIRKRPTKERDSFILKNRSLPRKEIANLESVKNVASRIDEIGVRNIISREKKRRKEV